MVYMDAPGVIVRCVHCDTVLLRMATDGERCWLDLRGITCLQINPGVLAR